MPTRTVFLAKKQDDDFIIDVFDFIGKDFFGEGVTAKSIAGALADSRGSSRIIVRINSPGGSVFEGVTIYNLLRESESKVHVEIHGLAASMATVVALAGEEVSIAEGAMFMIHNPWGFSMGESEDMRKTADMLDKIKSNMLDIYARHSNLSRDKLAKMMDDETWMTPLEAVRHGFASSIIADDEKIAALAPKDRTFATLSRYANVPSTLLEGLQSQDGVRLVAAMKEQPRKKDNNTMDRQKIIMLLGLPSDATDEQIETTLAMRQSQDLSQFVPRSDFDALAARLRKGEEEAREVAKASFESRVLAAVNSACERGKITPASKDYHMSSTLNAAQKLVDGALMFDLNAGEKQLAAFNSYVEGMPSIVTNTQMRDVSTNRGPVDDDTVMSNTELEVMKRLGVTTEELKAARSDMKNDPINYDPNVYRYAIG